MRRVTVAPVTTRARGLWTELEVGPANGLDKGISAVNCDNVMTIASDALGEQIGVLPDEQEPALSRCIRAAFDLE